MMTAFDALKVARPIGADLCWLLDKNAGRFSERTCWAYDSQMSLPVGPACSEERLFGRITLQL
jgi:hypothetical protein